MPGGLKTGNINKQTDNMKKNLLAVCAALCALFPFKLKADEGMWLPVLIQKLNIDEMHELGLQLSADDIYNINHSSLKDAIVQFGNGCTGEIVSPEGLLFTNHHCGRRSWLVSMRECPSRNAKRLSMPSARNW